MSTAGRLAAVLAGAALEGDGDVVVDLSQVEFMDARIIVVLLRSRDALQAQSRDLTLRAPSPFARRILQLCGLLGLVDRVSAVAVDEVDSGAMVGGTWIPAMQHNRTGQSFPQVAVPPLPLEPTSRPPEVGEPDVIETDRLVAEAPAS